MRGAPMKSFKPVMRAARSFSACARYEDELWEVVALSKRPAPNVAFLFDLDGTLVDSVYQHVLAWREALEKTGIDLAVWRIHRRIGMSGGLLAHALLRETGHQVTAAEAAELQRLHAEAYARQVGQLRPLRGARELLTYLTKIRVPWAIATSSWRESAAPTLRLLEIAAEATVITRDEVEHAKPNPDLFLASAARLGVNITDSVVVGDSVGDLLAARRALALGVGRLSGGYGQDELESAGAYRVYQDPGDLLNHLDEMGVRTSED
jgi:HAD superfamily hydrolase (TIGR01549 family)